MSERPAARHRLAAQGGLDHLRFGIRLARGRIRPIRRVEEARAQQLLALGEDVAKGRWPRQRPQGPRHGGSVAGGGIGAGLGAHAPLGVEHAHLHVRTAELIEDFRQLGRPERQQEAVGVGLRGGADGAALRIVHVRERDAEVNARTQQSERQSQLHRVTVVGFAHHAAHGALRWSGFGESPVVVHPIGRDVAGGGQRHGNAPVLAVRSDKHDAHLIGVVQPQYRRIPVHPRVVDDLHVGVQHAAAGAEAEGERAVLARGPELRRSRRLVAPVRDLAVNTGLALNVRRFQGVVFVDVHRQAGEQAIATV